MGVTLARDSPSHPSSSASDWVMVTLCF
jgi:hypothetical protein